MLSLRDAQRRFAAAVLDGSDAEYTIYRDNALACWTRALSNTYPVVEKLVGETFFREAARRFFERFPSRSGNLDDLGEDFAAFLRGYPPAGELAYLPDVARLEWNCHRALLAAEHVPFDPERFAQVPPEQYAQLRFGVHPSVSFFASDWPVHRIWQVNQPGWEGDASVELRQGGVRLAVKRAGARIELLAFAPGEWEFVCSLAGKLTFGEACARAWRALPEFDPGISLRRLIEEGLLV